MSIAADQTYNSGGAQKGEPFLDWSFVRLLRQSQRLCYLGSAGGLLAKRDVGVGGRDCPPIVAGDEHARDTPAPQYVDDREHLFAP